MHRRKIRRKHITAAVQQRTRAIALCDYGNILVFRTERIIERRATREVRVGTVAEGPVACVFAATEKQLLVPGTGGELDWTKACPFVGAIAKRLFCRAATAAPEIGAARFDVHQAWFRLRNNWVHRPVLSRTVAGLYRAALGSPA
jgi:hypothetical protein